MGVAGAGAPVIRNTFKSLLAAIIMVTTRDRVDSYGQNPGPIVGGPGAAPESEGWIQISDRRGAGLGQWPSGLTPLGLEGGYRTQIIKPSG